VRIASVRAHKGRLLLRLDGVDDANAAQAYVGAEFSAARDRVTLDPGEFFDDDLVGCTVRGIDGTRYGEVERVEHYPASDMLIVAGRMVPMVAAIVKRIDLDEREVTVDPPAGLLD
jgi:16S rRNA processing protein RimM